MLVYKRQDREPGLVIPPPTGGGPVSNLLGELKPCSGKLSDAQVLESHSRTPDFQNKLHLYGIIKNNSKDCALKSLTLKVTLSANGQVLQEQNINLIGEVRYPAFALQPQATKQYQVYMTVFESLVVKEFASTKLRSDVVKKEQIVSAEWVMPSTPKTNN